VLLDDATVKCFGDNPWGQLGTGDKQPRGNGPNQMGDKLPAVDLGTGKKAASVCAGYGHSCAVLTSGQVKCWGANTPGNLGYGDSVDRGGMPNQMGDALPAVDLGAGRSAVAVSCGSGSGTTYGHTCALLDDGGVKCWGANIAGELGQGDRVSRGDKPGTMGDLLPPVPLGAGRRAIAVSAGYTFTCALLDDHELKCWGGGDYLGLGRSDSRGAQPGQMGDALPAVDLGTGRRAIVVGAGYVSTCALLDDGHVKCWGFNGLGSLGYDDNVSRGSAPRQMGDYLPNVDLGACRATGIGLGTAYSGGTGQSCAMLENGTLKCWGAGGQLGIGDNIVHGAVPGDMGDDLPTVKLFSDAW
jgi:alpha-tubulin suppressor-like RCC1 family protein